MKHIRIIYAHILNVLIKFYFLFKFARGSDKEYYFSVCAIFKNEARYLKEWIEYHKMIGVDHFYLYNNFSEDHYQEVLQPYIDEGIVHLKEWPYEKDQMGCYANCYNSHKDKTKWLMFLDLDEFICLKEKDSIKEWITPYEKYPAIIIYWLMFGTNGLIQEDSNKLVIEQFTHCWGDIRNVGKQILNTDYTPNKITHHHMFCNDKFLGIPIKLPMINERKFFIKYPELQSVPEKNSIQINHYWSKSLNEYIEKIGKGDVYDKAHEEIRKKIEFFYWHEEKNVTEDKVIWRFLIKLKVQMENINFSFKD